ncbi:MAG: hypothetical protein SH817_10380 [Leptospira sp.]|nr:hypothetical protein [Leptospira sp.]
MSDWDYKETLEELIPAIEELRDFCDTTFDEPGQPETHDALINGLEIIKDKLDDINNEQSNEASARENADSNLQEIFDELTLRFNRLAHGEAPAQDSRNGHRKYLWEFFELISTDQIDGYKQQMQFFQNALGDKVDAIDVDLVTGISISISNPLRPRITQNRPLWSEIQNKPASFPTTSHSHDINEIVSLQTALDGKESIPNKGIANGYASLDGSGRVPVSQINSFALAMQIVNTIADRNALSPVGNLPVFVKNATGDISVSSGGALYLYEFATTSWIKLTEYESLDIIQAWSNITGKPSVFTADLSTVATGLTDTSGTMSASDSILTLFGKIKKFIADVPAILSGGWEVGDRKTSYRSYTTGNWLLLDGKTIGDFSSNATALANTSVFSLFEFLWNEYPLLEIYTSAGVLTTRGADPLTDFNAHKALKLWDERGRFSRVSGVSGNGQKANGQYYDGGAAGSYGNDKFQGFVINDNLPVDNGGTALSSSGVVNGWNLTSSNKPPISDGANGTPRTGNETTPAWISHYSWIKY